MLDGCEIIDDGTAEHQLSGDIDPLCDLALLSDALHTKDTAGGRVVDHTEEDELRFRPVVGPVLGAHPDLADTQTVAAETGGGATDRRHVEIEDLDRRGSSHRSEGLVPPARTSARTRPWRLASDPSGR